MTRIRGPNYPSFSLPEAIRRTSLLEIYAEDGRISRYDVAQILGYSSLNGGADKAIGTIIQFGLLERAKESKVQITDLFANAMSPNDAIRAQALRLSAQFPQAFQLINKNFGINIGDSGEIVRNFLRNSGFTERSIIPIVRSYVETMNYCQSNGSET
jgi:hypothetical protein